MDSANPRRGLATRPSAAPESLRHDGGARSGRKAENEALREQVRKIEEQQPALLDLVNQLQRRVDGPQIAEALGPAPRADHHHVLSRGN